MFVASADDRVGMRKAISFDRTALGAAAAAAFLVTALLSAPAPAFAEWFSETSVPSATAMAEGTRQLGPSAYRTMCRREPHLCRADRRGSRSKSAIAMTDAHWSTVLRINADVNAAIHPQTDFELYGVKDHWTAGVDLGDCEEYIVTKKMRLIEAGFRADQLLYAVVRGFRDPYHAVLVLRTTDGDFILDNEVDRVLPWEETGYDFVIRQSASDPGSWVRIIGRAPANRGKNIAQLQ